MSERIRLIAVDLDGTLLNDSKQMSERTIAALKCLPAQGIKVVIASARPPRSVRHIYQELGLDTLQINYNGALIWDEGKQEAFFHQPMEGSVVRRIIDVARSILDETVVAAEILDRWYTDREEQPFTTETGKLFKPDVVTDLEGCCAQAVTKLMLLGAPGLVSRLQEEVGAQFGREVMVLRTDEHLIQIMDPRAGKAGALRRVVEHYQVELSETMAIGDAPNDVEMLEISGIAVAMDNADARVKAVADWVAPSNNDHGVHAALVRFGLCGA
jgi:Cof subfamily protein (haloacid dehalogenase superfamily)